MLRLWSFLKIIHLWFEICFDLFWRKIHTRHPAALYVDWIKWKTFFCFYLLLCNIVYFLQMCLVLYNTTLALFLFLLWRILYAFHDVLNAFIACFTAILHLFAWAEYHILLTRAHFLLRPDSGIENTPFAAAVNGCTERTCFTSEALLWPLSYFVMMVKLTHLVLIFSKDHA